MPIRYRALANLVGTILGQVLLLLLIVALPPGGVRATAGVLYLFTAPALAVYLPLRGKDILSAVIVACAASVVVNAVVAEVMVETGMWSIAGGVAAIALISVILAVVGFASAVTLPQPSPPGFTTMGSTGGQPWR